MAKLTRRDFLKISAGAGAALAAGPYPTLGCFAAPKTSTVHALTGDALTELYDLGRQAAVKLGFTGNNLLGAKVFIKPNLVSLGLDFMGVSYDPTVGECTKPEIAVAVAEQCLAAGAAKVTIGEGAQTMSWDWSTITFLPGNTIESATNMKTSVDRLKNLYGDNRVELACLHEVDEWELVPATISDTRVENGINVARSYYQADHVISIPVLKTHQWAKMTASLKNMFGVTSAFLHGNGFSRCQLHLAYAHEKAHGVAEAGVSGAFMDLYKWRMDTRKEDFAILDGSICMEGDGPHSAPVNNGLTIDMKQRNGASKYFLLATDDFIAMDTVAAQLMNLPVDQVKALQMARNMDLGVMDRITMQGASIADLKVSDWQAPNILSEDEFAAFC